MNMLIIVQYHYIGKICYVVLSSGYDIVTNYYGQGETKIFARFKYFPVF